MCDMWYSKYSLECRHVTRPVLANELALAVRGEPCYEAVCCSSVLGWAGIERKYLKFVNILQFQEKLLKYTVPLCFQFQPCLERLSNSLWVLWFWF